MNDIIVLLGEGLFSITLNAWLAARFANIYKSKKDFPKVLLIIAITMLVTTMVYFISGLDYFLYLYPVYAQLPITLILWAVFHCSIYSSLVSTLIGFMDLAVANWFDRVYTHYSPLTLPQHRLLLYAIIIALSIWCVLKFFGDIINSLLQLTEKKEFYTFITIPTVYYIYDYFTSVQSSLYISGNYHVVQFMPFMVVMSFLIYSNRLYREQMRKVKLIKDEIFLENNMKIAESRFKALKEMQQQSRIYRHDMRHHFSCLSSLANAEQLDEFKEYLKENMDILKSKDFSQDDAEPTKNQVIKEV